MNTLRRLRRRPGMLALATLAALICALPVLAGCAVHTGGDSIAYLDGGRLWVANGDGSQPRLIASAVAGYAWSPDHHELVYRAAAQVTAVPPGSTLGVPDLPGSINVASINGGVPVQVSPNDGKLLSDAWWDAGGNRLVYRESGLTGLQLDYVVSQADQLLGIARKVLLGDGSIPAITPDGKLVAVLDALGNLRIGAPGAVGGVIASGATATLPGTGRPAHLLWRPGASEILYPTVVAGGGVALMLTGLHGKSRPIASVPLLLDAAFSPDGADLLLRTPTEFELWTVGASTPAFTWPESDPRALPWWSPDGHFILVHDAAGWQLADVAHHTMRSLLLHTTAAPPSGPPPVAVDWRPAAGSPWSGDGTHAVFVGTAGDSWLGTPLPAGGEGGLYVSNFAHGTFGVATRITSGAHAAPSWSYLDPSTTYLLSA
ncbi:MAG: hypothetical protein ACHQ4H_10845 [Ktedonobacterales bacterium]